MDPTDLRAKLAAERADTNWGDLEASGHLPAIVVVGASLDLVDVGVVLARNDVAQLQAWLQAGHVHRPTDAELAAWRAAPDTVFELLIIQPFVLVQQAVLPAARA